MNIFTHRSYKDFLKSYISQKKGRGVISTLASACGCDRTYLSQVLNGKAELTPDHMIQLCESLGLNALEREYLLLLLIHDRSGSAIARKVLNEQIQQKRKTSLAVEKHILAHETPNEVEERRRSIYYSSWIFGAVHILTSIPEFQTPAAISSRLSVSLMQVVETLNRLIDMGLVNQGRGRYVHSGGDLFLANRHPQNINQHLNWRIKAVERTNVESDIHYTLVFSVSNSEVEKLRLEIVELIERQRRTIRASGSESACVVCFDFFSI